MNSIDTILKEFPYRLILGSASPRRQELLKSLGFDFLNKPMKVDETSWPEELKAQEICIFLAEKKADAYDEPLKDDELLITPTLLSGAKERFITNLRILQKENKCFLN
ncbi:MAG: Maf-like protein [Bacteroidetes bacterium]|nr:Maf-like protein [Bacteroidota bacterium]